MPQWTAAQLAEIARQYERIGYRPGDHWPAPPDHFTAEQIIEILREIPDRGGLDRWRAALAQAM